MDKFDFEILRGLQRNGRMTWAALSEQVNLSASACQRRVEALQAKGVIERFTVTLNDEALGRSVKAFVAVNVDRQNTEAADHFAAVMQTHPKVVSAHMLSGSVDFMLEVVAENLADFAQFIDEELLRMDAVKDATSSIVLKVIKRHESLPAGSDA